MPSNKFNAKDFEKQLKREINSQLNAMTKRKVAIIFDTLNKLAQPLTHAGNLTAKGKRAEQSSNKRGGAVGSPVYTGEYDLNHMIAINGVAPAPILFGSTGEAGRVADPVNLSPEELVAREQARIPKHLKFTDTISIVNNDPKADIIEEQGTPLIPEGGFYAKAFEYMNARLQRDLGAAITATTTASTFDVDNFEGV